MVDIFVFVFDDFNFPLNILVSEPTPPVQQTLASWDDEFEPSDVATTVVESTLAEVKNFC